MYRYRSPFESSKTNQASIDRPPSSCSKYEYAKLYQSDNKRRKRSEHSRMKSENESSLFSMASNKFVRECQRNYFRTLTTGGTEFNPSYRISVNDQIKRKVQIRRCSKNSEVPNKSSLVKQQKETIARPVTPQILTRKDYLDRRNKDSVSPQLIYSTFNR